MVSTPDHSASDWFDIHRTKAAKSDRSSARRIAPAPPISEKEGSDDHDRRARPAHHRSGGGRPVGGALTFAVNEISRWMGKFGPYEPHSSLQVDSAKLSSAFTELTGRLRDNYPFFNPRYAGQMLKPPHPVAMIGYVATMLINPKTTRGRRPGHRADGEGGRRRARRHVRVRTDSSVI